MYYEFNENLEQAFKEVTNDFEKLELLDELGDIYSKLDEIISMTDEMGPDNIMTPRAMKETAAAIYQIMQLRQILDKKLASMPALIRLNKELKKLSDELCLYIANAPTQN